MDLLADVLAVIGAVVTVMYAAERVLVAMSHLVRAGIPVTAALQDLLDAVRRIKSGERVTNEGPLPRPSVPPSPDHRLPPDGPPSSGNTQ